MTQLESARKGIVTEAMRIVASNENVAVNTVLSAIADGTAVIPYNIHHTNCHPVGVGRMFTTKINANLGRSITHSGKGDELEKLDIALKAGADFVKTSTGFGTGGAKIEDIRIFRGHIGENVKMKAAGGVKSREDLEMFLEAGCERIGTSSAVKLLNNEKAGSY